MAKTSDSPAEIVASLAPHQIADLRNGPDAWALGGEAGEPEVLNLVDENPKTGMHEWTPLGRAVVAQLELNDAAAGSKGGTPC